MTAAEHLAFNEPESYSLVHAAVTAGAEYEYAVRLIPAVGTPSIPEQTCLRFALHYYGRVLYELARTDRSVRDLPALVDRIVNQTTGDRSLFAIAGVHGDVKDRVQHPVGDVSVVLRRVGIRNFEIDGTFRLAGRALALTVIAVLQVILLRLSPDSAGALLAGLANMNMSYTLTHHYGDPKSFREVPAIAYDAAAFV